MPKNKLLDPLSKTVSPKVPTQPFLPVPAAISVCGSPTPSLQPFFLPIKGAPHGYKGPLLQPHFPQRPQQHRATYSVI